MSLNNQSVIDFVAETRNGEVVLVIVEGRPWDASGARFAELANKVSTYVSFVNSGEIYQKYPEKPASRSYLRRIELPDPSVQQLIDRQSIGIHFVVKQIGTRTNRPSLT